MHLLADPAHKGNLLAVRKENLARPFGETRVFTVSPAGEESPVAASTMLAPHPRYGVPEIYSLAVRPYALSGKAAEHFRGRELEKRIAELQRGLEKSSAVERSAKWEQIRRMRAESRSFSDKLETVLQAAQRPAGRRVYSYRLRGIGLLLMRLHEEIAEAAGFPRVQAFFNKDTAARFMPRYGWKQVTPGGYFEKRFGKKS
ncbi:MAG: hypothetical protein AB1626_02685 [Candidatus Micrarchaeota archaeon]